MMNLHSKRTLAIFFLSTTVAWTLTSATLKADNPGSATTQSTPAAELFVVVDGQSIEYEVACDRAYCQPASGLPHVVAIEEQKTLTGLARHVTSLESNSTNRLDFVLFPKDAPRNERNRRILTRSIRVQPAVGADVEKIADEVGASSLDRFHFTSEYVVLQFDGVDEVLQRVHQLRGRDDVRSAEIQLRRKTYRRLIPNDPRFAWSDSNQEYQWHLKNTGQNGSVEGLDANVEPVWDDYHGTGVTISVVDDGVEVGHPDLAPNVAAAIDHNFVDPGSPDDPTPPLDEQPDGFSDHGTSVAGVAAGRGNNGIGGSGAAPMAQIAGLKLLGGASDDAMEASALAWRTDVIDISNNSWGAADDGKSLYKPGPLTLAALANGVRNGRDGKGVVYVWSAGNGRDNEDYANYDGYVNAIETIGVGAVAFNGEQSYYSESGSNVVVCAPSNNDGGDPGITTTTFTTNGSYTDEFGGTSSAAPLVSGVIALLLEANPNLGWRDVQELLIRTSRRINPIDPEWTTNGAGFRFHHGFGAGMIDAAALVALGESWTNLPAKTMAVATLADIDAPIPDDNAAGVTHTFEITDNLRVEHAVLTVDIDHGYRGDLVIALTSPAGTVSQLSAVHDDENDDYRNFPLMTVRNWGESSQGTWTVNIADGAAGEAGMLRSLDLEIHGAPSVTGYDAWVAANFTSTEQADAAISGPLADPDLDGRSNLEEYAFHTNPKVQDAAAGGLTIDSHQVARFSWDNRKTDIAFTLEESADLVVWEPAFPVIDSTDGGPIEEYAAGLAGPRRFVRLTVTMQN